MTLMAELDDATAAAVAVLFAEAARLRMEIEETQRQTAELFAAIDRRRAAEFEPVITAAGRVELRPKCCGRLAF